jgi:4-diphosphocytidyl-2-C-methyl-D-erythritol kinase
MPDTRRARVRALAKINLDLRVIGKRDDGYHELRTVFQTISLADRLELAFTPSRKTAIELRCSIDIADNLVTRAARLCLDAMKRTGRLEMRLEKRIPMGAGLGGGSSDAAAVLLALPVLAGGFLPTEELLPLATELGSDVPFFLLGGRAAGIGRGSELYPLPDLPELHGLLLTPGIHVSTPHAYRSLKRGRLTTELLQNKIDSFLAHVWSRSLAGGSNDFEEAVFRAIPRLASLKRKLIKAGASPAMMSGSGSALFGIFGARDLARRALDKLGEPAVPITLVSRSRYQALWRRWLATHRIQSKWPLRSRYAR